MELLKIRADATWSIRWVLIFLVLQLVLSLPGIVPAPFAQLAEEDALVNVGFVLFNVFLLQAISGIFTLHSLLATMLAGGAVGGGCLVLFQETLAGLPAVAKLFVVLGGFGVAALAAAALAWRRSDRPARMQIETLLAFMLFLWLFASLPHAALRLTSLLHPATFDAIAYHFDAALGFQPSVVMALWLQVFPLLKQFVLFSYVILPWGFAVLYALAVRHPEEARVDLLKFWGVAGLLAAIVYHLAPLSGPGYFFGQVFPLAVPEAGSVPDLPVIVQPVARNGVPSMHFGWALSFWLIAMFYKSRWPRHLFAIFLGITVMATLGLGEHYLVDLIAAIPFIIGILAISMRGGDRAPRLRIAMICGLQFLAWVIFLRFGIGIAKGMPAIVVLAELATIFHCTLLFRRIVKTLTLPATEQAQISHAEQVAAPTGEVSRVVLVFIFSGFAGLVYEVVFSKALALTFGSTALATYTVLATYMGGLALGAWVGGWVAQRASRPLLAFAFCEFGIGLYCILTPVLFSAMRVVYVGVAAGVAPDAGILTVLRFSLGVVVLLVPTVLMGMTLPLLARFLGDRKETLGVSVALLYGANTLGAALGALLTGYLLLPVLGVTKTILLAASLNFMVALVGMRIARFCGDHVTLQSQAGEAIAGPSLSDRATGWAAIAILTLGGVLTLALEIDYIHLLAIVAGNSAYAFALMLFTFLIGLSAGAVIARRLLSTDWPLGIQLAWMEAGLSAMLLAGVFGWEQIPAYFADFASYTSATRFVSREFVRGVVCAAAMLPPAVFIGMIYPIAFEAVGRAFPRQRMIVLGRTMALNTAGNIAGVVIAGFLLLPTLGALRLIHLMAVAAAGLALLAAYAASARRKLGLAPLLLPAFLAVPQPAAFDYSQLATGSNVYFMPQGFGTAIDHAESIDGGLTTVVVRDGPAGHPPVKTLLTNGKFQGNDALGGEMVAQAGFALAPLLHSSARERALVIGYGTGVSARTLHDAGFVSLDIVELSADIMHMADRHFASVNKRVTAVPGVTTYVTDGRNYLLLQPRQYDLISMEISSIWFAGASTLYNREFYQLAKARLKPRGILQQWVQLHHMRGEDFLAIIATVRSEFAHVWLYLIGGQGILVATNDAGAQPLPQYLQQLERTPGLQNLLSLYGGTFATLRDQVLLEPAAMDYLVRSAKVPARYLVATDDNMVLEYGTPKGNVLDGLASMEAIIAMTRRAREDAAASRSAASG